MLKTIKIIFGVLIILLLSGANTTLCYANSAEPPSILIIVPNPPSDLEISIGEVKGSRQDKATESYFRFYKYRDFSYSDYPLTIRTSGQTYQIVMPEVTHYTNIYTLDIKKQTLTPGRSLTRPVILTAVRIILTLLLEGLLFFLFGYRKKKSWLIFLIVNLITQGTLNILLGVQFTPINQGYVILYLIFGEILVFFVELILFCSLVDEHKRLRTAAYVVLANLLSLIAGGYLITFLPL